jgi:hypothetical protein
MEECPMKIEDEIGVTKLITDYVCWWDDRMQHKDFLAQLDDNAVWELWLIRDSRKILFKKFTGKGEILAFKTPDTSIAHSVSSFVIRANDDNQAEARAYFRTHRKIDGVLINHGEGIYVVNKVEGEWKLVSIINHYYWRNDQDQASAAPQ